MNFSKLVILTFIVNFSLSPLISYAEETPPLVSNCSGCHGVQGKSANPELPNLAAQRVNYITSQLNAFNSGARKNSVMQAIAAQLNEQNIAELAGYYAGLAPVSSGADPALAKAGEGKAAMCLGCHGSRAQGNNQIPRLAGQAPGYLIKQLQNFKSGFRQGGPMQAISSSLSDQDMAEISAYLGSLQ
ncbi:c-type cytochrome [Methylocucumis oryzae]|uniref:Cytochrome C n=1 Tax=Methylocucumis oryzae TaxID=1632867 RepID=A0A0F3IFS5_9GAMM|nr:c-type cytochrome [Methylocucumis oryzae]KJV05591.1 cytochrome C [Methylocucumis oryzae]